MAEHVDMILVFMDPIGQATCKRTMEVRAGRPVHVSSSCCYASAYVACTAAAAGGPRLHEPLATTPPTMCPVLRSSRR